MAKLELPELRRRARNHALLRGYASLAEDFSSYCTVIALENPKRRSTISQMFIDFQRAEYGKTSGGSSAESARAFASHTMRSLDEPLINGFSLGETLVKDSVEIFTKVELNEALDKLDGISRSCILLYYLWGLSAYEIAYCYGITEVAVWLRLKKVPFKIQRALKKSRQDKHTLSRLLGRH